MRELMLIIDIEILNFYINEWKRINSGILEPNWRSHEILIYSVPNFTIKSAI